MHTIFKRYFSCNPHDGVTLQQFMEHGKVSDSYERRSFINKSYPLVGMEVDNLPGFSLQNSSIEYEPFPAIFSTNIFQDDFYLKLVNSFPDESIFKVLSSAGNKFLLSEGSDLNTYLDYVNKHPEWGALYSLVKSVDFVRYCCTFLKRNNIDLGIDELPVIFRGPEDVTDFRFITARFEFSSIATNGGFHMPHTDIKKKLVSIVIPITNDAEWKTIEIGGTGICYPKDKSLIFNQVNRPLPLDQVDIVKRYPFQQNSALLVPKTYNSWHCVEPIFHPTVPYRRSIVIQLIESK